MPVLDFANEGIVLARFARKREPDDQTIGLGFLNHLAAEDDDVEFAVLIRHHSTSEAEIIGE